MVLRDWIFSALFAAIIAIFAQITIPFALIPITGQTFAIGLSATILGSKKSVCASLLYLLMGAVGMPVFSGFSGGVAILIGPKGGYLFSFLLVSFFIGIYLEKTKFNIFQSLVANIFGMFITLFIGTFWLKVSLEMSWSGALVAGFFPFIIVGIIKAAFAAFLGIIIRKRLETAKLKL